MNPEVENRILITISVNRSRYLTGHWPSPGQGEREVGVLEANGTQEAWLVSVELLSHWAGIVADGVISAQTHLAQSISVTFACFPANLQDFCKCVSAIGILCASHQPRKIWHW